MTDRAYSADEIIEAMARAHNPTGWEWYDRAIEDHPAKPIFLAREIRQMRAAALVFARMSRVPTEGQMKAMRRIFCCGAPDIGECTRRNCEAGAWDAEALAVQSTASDARIAEIEAGLEEKSK